jgi:uncharacterized membrane protein
VITVSFGTGLLIIALAAQFIIAKRLKDTKLRTIYAWIAWICAIIGGAAASGFIGGVVGITGAGATVASVIGLLFLVADLKDHRPDWPAFIIACTLPAMMRLSGGFLGGLVLALTDASVKLVTNGQGA